MSTFYFKRGDTFSLECEWTDKDGLPLNLTGYTITSKVKTTGFEDTLVVTIVNAAAGLFTISRSAVNTASWPVTDSPKSLLKCDIQRVSGALVRSTQTFFINVEEDVT
jgi:hypothetical protein